MRQKIEKIIEEHYDLDGEVLSFSTYGSGHIHKTYKVVFDSGKQYVFQRFNHHVFKNVEIVHANLKKITRHIYEKSRQPSKENRTLLFPIPTNQGKLYCEDENNGFFRVFHYIEGSQTFDIPTGPKISFAAGAKFGEFLNLLSDYPPSNLKETIPNFHKMSHRFAQFQTALKTALPERRQKAENEIENIIAKKEEMHQLEKMEISGLLPLRVTHNDTKLNNILFDQNEEALFVIDLDTVMPGLVHFDFGDAIRTIANNGAEDSKNLNEITFSKENFHSFSEGFLGQVKEFLTPNEKESLHLAPKTMTFSMILRFLTDFLDNDIYFHVNFDDHNLFRAKAQLKFLLELEKENKLIKKTISTLLSH